MIDGAAVALKALADKAGAAFIEAERAKPAIKAWDDMRKQVQALYDASPEAANFTLKGDKYEIQIGPRENERKIPSMRKLFKAIKEAVFLEHCSFPMKIVDALLPGEKQAGLVVTARTGSRPVKAIPLASTEEKGSEVKAA
jgi:hypothetical protein